jgi:2'-5' RNA ligase
VRCFVAVDVSDDVRAALARVQRRLRTGAPNADVRWVDVGGIHLTLAFLGAVADERPPEILAALARAAAGRRQIALAAREVGGFPSRRRPRVLWVGVGGEVAALARLAGAVAAALEPLGFPPEERPFHPHLTLARVRSPRGLGRLVAALEAAGEPDLGAWTVREVVLYRSRLRPGGAVYEALGRVALDP